MSHGLQVVVHMICETKSGSIPYFPGLEVKYLEGERVSYVIGESDESAKYLVRLVTTSEVDIVDVVFSNVYKVPEEK